MNTRREFLGWLAALPAAALVKQAAAQVERLPRRGPAQRVIVLGAGLAGLCSAYELQSQGHQVTVLQAQLRPGGRVRSLREGFAPGLYVEAGAEAIPRAHDLTLHYANTFGLKLLPVAVPGTRSFYHVGGRRILPDAKTGWPFELTDEERRLGIAGLSQKYIEEAVQQALAARFWQQPIQAMSAWDAQTPGAWLRSRGASPGAAELLALGFGTEFGSAASYLLHRLNSMSSPNATGPSSYRIEGGNDHLPEEFSKRVNIRYGTAVVGLSQNDRMVQVSIRSAGGTDGGLETLIAERVICALPCPVTGKIFEDARLSSAKQLDIREQNYSRKVKVFLQTRTRFWLKDGSAGTSPPISRLKDPRRIPVPTAPNGAPLQPTPSARTRRPSSG